jgi:hypothetical protein
VSLEARIVALAQAIGADIKSLVVGKVDKVAGLGLSEASFLQVEKSKLAGLVTTANTLDSTVGRLLKVGDFGVGGDSITLASNVNWDTIATPGRYYIPGATGVNVPISGSNWFVEVIKNGSIIKQSAVQQGSALRLDRAYVSGAWLNWDMAYNRTSLLGGVSQVSGQPTGSVIERGSNANGEYVRLADGTQICTFKTRTIKTINISSGQLFFGGAEPARSFPMVFAAAPTVAITAALESGEGWFLGGSSLVMSTSAWPPGYVFSQLARSAMQVAVEYIAIGRWY